ncbi:MAG: CCA tRNA nucleotidyltransferase, partial [Nocardioidaceae bacterium]
MSGTHESQRAKVDLSTAQRNAIRALLQVAPIVDDLGRRFADRGGSLALVGGSVRDALLDRLGTDLDFTTSLRPDAIEAIVGQWADTMWDVGRRFGTIGCRKGDAQIEITTYRSDSYDGTTRKPSVEFGDSLDGDLARRDFTVNAMAVSVPDHAFIDPFGGLEDLADGVLRTPIEPEVSFGDDPLRMMRAARFTAQLGFRPDPSVTAAITAMADRIDIVSAERVRDELVKLLLGRHPRAGLRLLVDTGLADHVLP